MAKPIDFATPTGRLIMGSVSKGSDKDADGKPYTIKTGVNAGKPTVKYFVGVAVPKTGEANWWDTWWGKLIVQVGQEAFPQACSSPDFAWKVEDGDSVVPNKKGKKLSDRVGAKGNWVLMCGTSLPIKAVNNDGSKAMNPEEIKTGFFVQVAIRCAGNDSSQNPGVYLNPMFVSLQYFGEEIHQGPDPGSFGFGQGARPAGALDAPAPGMTPGPMAGPAGPASGPGAASRPASPASGPVAANPAILGPGSAPAAPAAPAAPPPPPAAPAGPVMTAKAAGATYESFIARGWTLIQMKEQGYVL